jgi:hypothetical protein
MREPNPGIHSRDKRITGTETQGSLLEWDQFFYRPRQELAQTKIGISGCVIGIRGYHCLEFVDGILKPILRT